MEEKLGPIEYSWRNQGLGQPWGHPGSPSSQDAIKSALNPSYRDLMGFDGLGACMRQSVGGHPPPYCSLMQLVGIDDKKQGKSTLPLALRWWGMGGTTLVLLSPPSLEPKWCLHRRETQESANAGMPRSDGGEQGAKWHGFPLDERRRGNPWWNPP